MVAQCGVSSQLVFGDRLGAVLELLQSELDVVDLDAGVPVELGHLVGLLEHIDDVLEAEIGQPGGHRRLHLDARGV